MSTVTLVAYAGSAGPLGALAVGVFVYLPAVYAEVTEVSMAALGLGFLVARLWDVLSDPLVGWLSDRTTSRFGRRRPWVLLAWIPMSVAVLALCRPPPDATAVYLIVWSLVFYSAGTALYMPYTAWGAELSDDYHERARVFAWRHVFTALGTLSAAAMLALHAPAPGLSREAQAIDTLSVFGVAVLPFTLLALFWKVPDRVPIAPPPAGRTWRDGLAALTENRPLRIMLGAYLLNGIANALLATLVFLYIDSILQADAKAPALMTYFGVAILATPIWLVASRRWGKHRTWRAAMLVGAAALLATPLIGPGDLTSFYAVVVILGITLGADLTLPGAMQADVVDAERARNGLRRTGIYFALWAMVAKISLALAVGISFPILDWFGFEPEAVNAPGALTSLIILFAVVPLALKLGAALVVSRYPLSAAQHAALRDSIERDLGQPPMSHRNRGGTDA